MTGSTPTKELKNSEFFITNLDPTRNKRMHLNDGRVGRLEFGVPHAIGMDHEIQLMRRVLKRNKNPLFITQGRPTVKGMKEHYTELCRFYHWQPDKTVNYASTTTHPTLPSTNDWEIRTTSIISEEVEEVPEVHAAQENILEELDKEEAEEAEAEKE